MNEWNDIAVLTPPGDIDIASVPALRRRLDNLIDRGRASCCHQLPDRGLYRLDGLGVFAYTCQRAYEA